MPGMKWTFMSLQILDDVRSGKMTFAEMFPRARAAGFVAYDASDMDAIFRPFSRHRRSTSSRSANSASMSEAS